MADSIEVSKENGHVCPHQMGFMLDNTLRKWIQNPKRIVGGYINYGDTVIDMGCGPGFFTIDMAKLVGREGKVIAVDLQAHMLSKVKRKAEKHGVSDRITFHQCESKAVGLNTEADFILAYYMVHESPDAKALLEELGGNLKENGKLLVVEPKFHVSKTSFNHMLMVAEGAGLEAVGRPKGKGGRSALFMRRRG